jgi:phosphoglycolate phosphatase-like HAD superfamily hydrolase
LRGLGHQPLPKECYWSLKRQRVPEQVILERTVPAPLAAMCVARRGARIESQELLRLDSVLPGIEATLQQLSITYRLVLVSFRRIGANLHHQVDSLRLAAYFDAILPCYQSGVPGWRAKSMSIQADPLFQGKGAIMIGDTEDDIEAGRSIHIQTVAVLSGMRDYPRLSVLKPTVILDSLVQLPDWLRDAPINDRDLREYP